MLSLDITGVLGKTITPSLGIPEQEFKAIQGSMQHAVEEFLRERSAGKHAWADAPRADAMITQVKDLAKTLRKERIETILWIGIGGSALGPRVVKEVFENTRTPELVILDTIDPAVLLEELKTIDWARALLVLASKSGGTVEPTSVFFLVLERMRAVLKERTASRVLVLTDPETGFFRELVRREGYASLPIHPGVGGRYSIFTPVGLLPLALLGGDIDSFVRGASTMDRACQNESLDENPAALLAATQYLLDVRRNYPIRVIMPYSTRLQSLGRWEQQLLSESLGKTEAYGPTPLASIGTQDQHSMLQQWMQGRRLHWHLFIRESEKPNLAVPQIAEPSLSYLSGKTFGELLDACAEGTARALTAAKRPNVTITLPRLDEEHLGELFFLFMMEVVFLGKLYRVDPYGQPGVELGKKIAKDILSRGA